LWANLTSRDGPPTKFFPWYLTILQNGCYLNQALLSQCSLCKCFRCLKFQCTLPVNLLLASSTMVRLEMFGSEMGRGPMKWLNDLVQELQDTEVWNISMKLVERQRKQSNTRKSLSSGDMLHTDPRVH